MRTICKYLVCFQLFLLSFYCVGAKEVLVEKEATQFDKTELVEKEIVPEKPQADEDLNDELATEKKKSKKHKNITIDTQFSINLIVDLCGVFMIIVLIYHRNYHKSEHIFTFFAFNLVIFVLTYVMNHVKLSMGAAFGLFAVFSMLRYRTEGISPKDMTYLFIVIALGLICAIKLDINSLLFVVSLLVFTTWLLDGNVIFKRQHSKLIKFDSVGLIKPSQNEALIEELKNRTGLNIYKVIIHEIDYLRDAVSLEVFYYI